MPLRYYEDEAIAAATRRVERVSGQRARYSRASGRWTLLSSSNGLAARATDVPPTSNWGRQFQAFLDQEQSRRDARAGRSAPGGSGGGSGVRSATPGSGSGGGSGGAARGALGVAGSVLGLGGSLAGGALRLGAGVAGGLAGGALSLVGSVLGALGGLLRAGLGQVLGMVSGLLSGLLRLAVAIPRAVLGGLGKLSGAILGAMGNAARALSQLLTGVLKGALVGIGAAVGALALGLKQVVKATDEAGRSIRDLSASTGLGSRASGATQARFGVMGLDASKMMAGRNPAISAMIGSVFGVGGFNSPNFLPGAAAKFQSLQGQGMGGQLMAQQMAKSIGMDSPEGLRALATPVGKIAEQQRFASRTQQALGVDGSKLAAASQSWELLTNKVKFASATALQAIGIRLMPALTRWAEGALRIFESFAGRSGGWLDKGVSLFVSGVERAFSSLLVLGRWLYSVGPAAAFRFADAMLSGLSAVIGAVPSLWQGFLHGLDFLQSVLGPGLSTLAQVGGGAMDVLLRGVNAAAAGISALVAELPKIGDAIGKILKDISENPMVKTALSAAKTLAGAAPAALDLAEKATRPGGIAGRALGDALGGSGWGDVGEIGGRWANKAR